MLLSLFCWCHCLFQCCMYSVGHCTFLKSNVTHCNPWICFPNASYFLGLCYLLQCVQSHTVFVDFTSEPSCNVLSLVFFLVGGVLDSIRPEVSKHCPPPISFSVSLKWFPALSKFWLLCQRLNLNLSVLSQFSLMTYLISETQLGLQSCKINSSVSDNLQTLLTFYLLHLLFV